MLDHQEILFLIAKGDRIAFRKLYDIYAERVYNTALSYIREVQQAEEITQDVFSSVYKNATSFKGDSKVSTWIYRIAVNTSLNYVKKNNKISAIRFSEFESDKPEFEHPGVLLEKKEHSIMLFKVIDTLPDSQKTAFIMSFIEELPRQEVADVMEVSLKAVESLLQRGKKNLRDRLEKHYPDRRKRK